MSGKSILFGVVLIIATLAFGAGSVGEGLRVIPHLPSESGGFVGTLVINNQSRLEKKVGLICYSIEGKELGVVELSLGERELKLVNVHEVLPEGTSHAVLTGSKRVNLSVLYRSSSTIDANSCAGEVLSQQADIKVIPSFENQSDDYWEGAAVVNTGDKEGVIMIDVMADGILGPPGRALPIKPMEKIVFTFSSLFNQKRRFQGEYYQISSDQPFAFLGLAGTTNHKILWPVAPNPVQQYKGNAFSQLSVRDLQVDPYSIEKLSLSEEILTVSLQYPDGCSGALKLFMSGGFMESMPVQTNLTLQRVKDPDQDCPEGSVVEDRVFDLTPLIQSYRSNYGSEEEILLNIYDYQGERVEQLKYQPAK
ncbi:MAG: hypothetical protein CR997_12360 [Acidobacteria bacterium]|nr:MAG: hypothetical protein CR997_12360 [Acidobacteriota bacterium]